MTDRLMQDRYRLKKTSDFALVYAARRRRDGRLLTVHSRPNQLGHPRVGFSVSTRVGGAVVRNTIKRRLRAILGDWIEAGHQQPSDYVVVARPGSAAARIDALRADLLGLLGESRAAASEERPGPGD